MFKGHIPGVICNNMIGKSHQNILHIYIYICVCVCSLKWFLQVVNIKCTVFEWFQRVEINHISSLSFNSTEMLAYMVKLKPHRITGGVPLPSQTSRSLLADIGNVKRLLNNNGACTKWPTICRRYFKSIFVTENVSVLILTLWNFISQGPVNHKQAMDNGFVSIRRQAITLTIDSLVNCRMCGPIGPDGLNKILLWHIS